MTSPTPAARELRRAGVASGLMVVSALLAHVAAGGTVPPPSVLAVVVSTLVVVGVAVSAGSLGRWAGVGLVGGSQLVVHEVLVLTAGWSARTGPGVLGTCATDHGHAVLVECVAGTGAVAAAPAAGTHDLRMVVLHAVATVVTGWLLGAGDRVAAAARAVLRDVWREAAVPHAVVERTVPRWVEPVAPTTSSSVRCVLRRPRRGPPRWACASPSMPV